MITSTSNPRIKAIRKLRTAKGRHESGRTMLEGPNGLEALRTSELRPAEILMLENDAATASYADEIGVDATVVSPGVLAAASDTQHPLGPVCVIDVPEPRPMRSNRTVCLVDIADPGNVGTIIRTAAAFGWDVAICGATADPWSPKALRASAGTTLRVRIARASDPIGDAGSLGMASVALVVAGGDPPAALDRPIALLVGSEAHGLPQAMIERASGTVSIPMGGGVESLNAAVAVGISLYALG